MLDHAWLPRFVTHLLGLIGEASCELAKRDDAGRTAIDAQRTSRALVLVHDEEALVGGVLARVVHVDTFSDGVDREVVDALPRADVDAAFAENAL